MSDYKMTVGLEVHAELNTKSKMFCGCANDPEQKTPNIHICPVCMGYPGSLPVVNKEAVKAVLSFGVAVGGTIPNFTEFDRKNYFYPDIPKGYQISQYKYPLVSGGKLAGVELTRVHLEEDTAKSSHEQDGYSLVDFNRAGVPLMELVTEPVITSAEQAGLFARELQLTLQYLGISHANMEKGEMRVEVNISVSNTSTFGTKVEVKNLNSFRAVERAIAYEYARQVALLTKGGEVVQETRGWDENKQQTFSQRKKESAHDYRYFADPDIPKFFLSTIPDFSIDALRSGMSELPQQKRERFLALGIKESDVEVYVTQKEPSDFFEKVLQQVDKTNTSFLQKVSNYITSDLVGLSKTSGVFGGMVTPEHMIKLITMTEEGLLSSRGVKDLLSHVYTHGGDVQTLAEEKNLIQKNNEEDLKKIIEKIISENPNVVTEYTSGKKSVLQFFVGQGMKETKGGANPEILKKIAESILEK